MNIRRVKWVDEEALIRAVREAVFVAEQRVPPELEWDGLDDAAAHVLMLDDAGHPIGTARLLSNGQIGRMAVLKEWRGRGIGSALLKKLLTIAKSQGMSRVFLNAQTTALGFYERFGLIKQGEEFLDAGIPHYRMTLSIIVS